MVFPEGMSVLDINNPSKSLKTIEDYIRYMQERIDFSISHLKADYIDLAGAISWTDLDKDTQARISAAGGTLSLSVTNREDSSVIKLQKDGIDISSQTIKFTGDIIFKSNLTDGTTTISGSNIKTGTISAERIGAGSFTMTGGSININADSAYSSAIQLTYGQSGTRMSPYGIEANGPGGKLELSSATLEESSVGGIGLQASIGGALSFSNGNVYLDSNRYGSIYFNGTSVDQLEVWIDDALNSASAALTTANSALTVANGKYGYSDDAYFSKVYISNAGSISGAANARLAETSPYQIGYSGSSRRYKTDITKTIKAELDPHNLYKLDVVQFKFRNDWLDENDERYGKDVIGLIAEDVQEIMGDIYADFGEGGKVVDWDSRYIIPAMLYLIQEQHKEIEELKNKIA